MTYEVVALDSNVVIAVLGPMDKHHEAAVAFLEERATDPLILPAAVYAEVMAGPRPDLVKQFLREYRLRPVFNGLERAEVGELAAERFARYVKKPRKLQGTSAPPNPGRLLDWRPGPHATRCRLRSGARHPGRGVL